MLQQLTESDITGLKVLNRVMNKTDDWDNPRATPDSRRPPLQESLHSRHFLGRSQELAVQMAQAFGKFPPAPNSQFSREEGLQICLRLQGFGLAQELQKDQRQVPITDYVARLTPRGMMLLRLLGEDVPKALVQIASFRSDRVLFEELGTGMRNGKGTKALFAGRHFDREVILLCVRWYLLYKLSLRDLVG